jgi:transcriptional regulator with XRE-family HTH domain
VDKLVGERIRKYRVISGLSQENMAEEIGMSTGNYGKIERGEISISITHLSLISAVLGKSISELVEVNNPIIEVSKEQPGFVHYSDFNVLASTVKSLEHEVNNIKKIIEVRR